MLIIEGHVQDIEDVTDEELDHTKDEDDAIINLVEDNQPFDVDYVVDRPTDDDDDDDDDEVVRYSLINTLNKILKISVYCSGEHCINLQLMN